MINVLAWLVFGVLAGLIASRIVKPVSSSIALVTVSAGVMGALAGGIVFLIFDTAPLASLNLSGLIVALASAIIMIGLARLAVGRPS